MPFDVTCRERPRLMSPPTRRALLLVCALLVAACGSDGQPTASRTATEGRAVAVVNPSEGEVPALHPSVDDYPDATVGIEWPDDQRSVSVAVKVAHTAEQRSHGLMEVEDLPDGVGMVFLFPDDRTSGFWMKNTKVPLSIAWAAADGRIVDIQQMDPCEADPCPVYEPDEPYRNALEVPQGWFEEQGIGDGWTLRLPDGMPPPE